MWIVLGAATGLLLLLAGWVLIRLRTLDKSVLDACIRDFDARSTPDLETLLLGLDYFQWSPAEDGRTLRSVAELRPYFEALDARRWAWLDAHCDAWLGALAGAERTLGYAHRPMLLDYETALRAAVRVLAKREAFRGEGATGSSGTALPHRHPQPNRQISSHFRAKNHQNES